MRTWFKVYDDLPSHPMFVGMSDAALACWLRGYCYASQYLLDGELPGHAAPMFGKPKAIAEVVARGAWIATASGWSIAGYLDDQRSREEVEEDRAKKAAAGSKGNHERWHVGKSVRVAGCRWCDRTSIASAIPDAIANGSQSDRTLIAEAEAEPTYLLGEVEEPDPEPVDNQFDPAPLVAAARSKPRSPDVPSRFKRGAERNAS